MIRWTLKTQSLRGMHQRCNVIIVARKVTWLIHVFFFVTFSFYALVSHLLHCILILELKIRALLVSYWIITLVIIWLMIVLLWIMVSLIMVLALSQYVMVILFLLHKLVVLLYPLIIIIIFFLKISYMHLIYSIILSLCISYVKIIMDLLNFMLTLFVWSMSTKIKC